MDWICVEQCYQFGLLWEPGDIAVSEENLGFHFVPFEPEYLGGFELSGRKFLIEKNELTGKNEITGVWE